MANRYIYVIDSNSDAVDWLDSLFTIGDILVVSVQDMVEKVLRRVSAGTLCEACLLAVTVLPDTSPSARGPNHDTSGTRSLQLDPATGRLLGNSEHHIQRLARKFTSDAVVTLGGCQTGNGSARRIAPEGTGTRSRSASRSGNREPAAFRSGNGGQCDAMRCAAPARRCPALGGAVLAVEASTDRPRVQRLAARVKRPWAVTTSPWRPTAEVRPLVVRSGLFIAQTWRFRTSSYGEARAQSLAPLQQPSRSMSGFASPATAGSHFRFSLGQLRIFGYWRGNGSPRG